MKLKPMSILAGVLVAATLATAPLAAFAQNSKPTPQAPQTQQSPQTQPRARIRLTEEQQKQFLAIQESAIGQIEAVLTPQQKTQFAQGRETGRGLDAIQNLSDEQKEQIVGVLQELNKKIGNLLTPEQKRTIEQSQSNSQ